MTSVACVELGPGTLIGSYRLVKEIGQGGMGTVYEAHHTVLPRRAAVKVMHAEHVRQPGVATRVVQEAAVIEDLHHAGLVRVFECNVLADRRPWIAMELIEGESLAARLARLGTLPAEEVATLLGDVADVLVTVHRHGVIHRDLKPDNLLLVPGDRAYPLRLIDWGVAWLRSVARLTLDGATPGTPAYMAPEQVRGQEVASPCDIYSLGAIAYEALTGEPPFDGATIAEIVYRQLMNEPEHLGARGEVPAALAALVHRMLDAEPAGRPTARGLRDEARAIARTLAAEDYVAISVELEISVEPEPEDKPEAELELELDTVVVDPDEPDGGGRAPAATIPRPRWTPPYVASVAAIAPSAGRAEVAGEFIAGRGRPVPRRR